MKKARTLVITVIAVVLSLSAFAGNKNDTIPELTVDNLKMELEKYGVQHAEIVLRQAISETGWFNCTSCSMDMNNIFGFIYKKKYLQFDNWVESVKYYKWWQDKLYSKGNYYDFLKKVGYATDPRYINLLKSIKL
jgi:flagellum-specific peptidoglycan hydrolase FlgJ